MLKKRIIPCLDVKNGRVVKGVNFENLIDAGDPVMQAEFYYQQGADEICFLDISASSEGRSTMIEMVKNIAKKCFIPITVGGGVANIEDFANLIKSGADKVSINSSAIKNPQLIFEASKRFGSQAVVIAIDAKKVDDINFPSTYQLFTLGGTKETKLDALEWAIEAQKLGAGEILLTSMNRDGTKQGYDLELIKLISSNVNIPVIASGGVGELAHLKQGLDAGASALLAASIFHFRKFSISEVKKYLYDNNFLIRL
ncbi:MAG: imidazole glycerol phosphate synthase subunit HisF [Rickettsiales bacterium]|nr:imidazole glycerol phosphate synthase subunit HisF [Rickettsiales bacterium]